MGLVGLQSSELVLKFRSWSYMLAFLGGVDSEPLAICASELSCIIQYLTATPVILLVPLG